MSCPGRHSGSPTDSTRSGTDELPALQAIVSKQKVKRRRSRTGCITCRIRHIKCDEAKPDCANCQRSGMRCEKSSNAPSFLSTSTFSASPNSTPGLLHTSVSADVFGNDQERRHFQFFRLYTASEFAGHFDLDFWSRLVLQISHSQPSVRHAIVALGSLHESRQSSSYKSALSEYSMLQYNKAIRTLRSDLSSEKPQNIGIALVCCILFICLETYKCNYESASAHLRNGLNILRSWQSKTSDSKDTTRHSSPEDEFIRENLLPLFISLDIQATTFEVSRSPQLSLESKKTGLRVGCDMPSSFNSIREAKDHLDILLYMLYYSLPEPVDFGIGPPFMTTRERKQPPPVPRKGTLKKLFRSWISAFDVFLKKSSSRLSTNECAAAILLKIYHTIGLIMITTSINPGAYGSCDAEFQLVTDLAESLLKYHNDKKENQNNNNKPIGTTPIGGNRFKFDMGIVAPLHYVGVKCRKLPTRKRAIALLNESSRREGLWDGAEAAQSVQWLLDFEEANTRHESSLSAMPRHINYLRFP